MKLNELVNLLEKDHDYDREALIKCTRLQLVKIANREGIRAIIGDWESEAVERKAGMEKAEIEIGLRVHNRGDMANLEHWGTVTKIIERERFADQVEITPDPEAERKPYTVFPIQISAVDKGHGGTRIVTEQAYNEFREKQLAALQERMNTA